MDPKLHCKIHPKKTPRLCARSPARPAVRTYDFDIKKIIQQFGFLHVLYTKYFYSFVFFLGFFFWSEGDGDSEHTRGITMKSELDLLVYSLAGGKGGALEMGEGGGGNQGAREVVLIIRKGKFPRCLNLAAFDLWK